MLEGSVLLLRKNWEAQIVELEKQIDDLRHKISVINEYDQILQNAGVGNQPSLFEVKTPITDKYKYLSFPDATTEVLKCNPNRDWLVNEVAQELILNGKGNDNSPSFRNNVVTNLRRLEKRGLVTSKNGPKNKLLFRLRPEALITSTEDSVNGEGLIK